MIKLSAGFSKAADHGNSDEIALHFGKALRMARAKLGVDLRHVAKAVGTDASNVSRWERGIARPNIYFAACLARVLNLSLDEILLNKSQGGKNEN